MPLSPTRIAVQHLGISFDLAVSVRNPGVRQRMVSSKRPRVIPVGWLLVVCSSIRDRLFAATGFSVVEYTACGARRRSPERATILVARRGPVHEHDERVFKAVHGLDQ